MKNSDDLKQLHFTLDSFLKKNQTLLYKDSYEGGQQILEEINKSPSNINELVKNFIFENSDDLIKKYIKKNCNGYDIGLFLSHIKSMEKYTHIELLDTDNIYVILIMNLHKIYNTKKENNTLIISNIKLYVETQDDNYLNEIFKYGVTNKKTSLVDKLKNHVDLDDLYKNIDKNLVSNMKGVKLIEYLKHMCTN